MCDHCAKVTTQKDYSGHVTCKCEHPEKKIEEKRDVGGCCGRKVKESSVGSCPPTCCKNGRSISDSSQSKKESKGGCCRDRK